MPVKSSVPPWIPDLILAALAASSATGIVELAATGAVLWLEESPLGPAAATAAALVAPTPVIVLCVLEVVVDSVVLDECSRPVPEDAEMGSSRAKSWLKA